MSSVIAHESVRHVEIDAVVTRCGCSAAQKEAANWHAKRGQPCPNPRATEDLGTIVRWDRSPLRRAWYALRRLCTGKV